MIERITNYMNEVSVNEKTNIVNKNNLDHIDFIVGRGHIYPSGCMNIPMNPIFNERNVIFVDSNPTMGADIVDLLENVNFDDYGITSRSLINLRFIFDWSTFYCSAIYSMKRIAHRLKHRMEIYVPLESDEQMIPSEILSVMDDPIFTITIQDGFYPLFDPRIKETYSIFNIEKYIKIQVNDI